jgi:hypothetical protein
MEQLDSYSTDINEIWYLRIFFEKSVVKNSILIEKRQNTDILHENLRKLMLIRH